MLGRDTTWRQGCLLTQEAAHKLGVLALPQDMEHVVIVISHDCDLPNTGEASVELIVATKEPEQNAMFAKARHPRRLHLMLNSVEQGDLCIELRHERKTQVCKQQFADIAKQQPYTLSPDEKRALKQWLAARYGRPAFPNAFESRLNKKIRKKSLEQAVAKILEPASVHLVAVFFDLGEDRTEELTDGEAYALSISVVYDSTEGGAVAREAAESVASNLQDLFTEVYGEPSDATEIALESCQAVADTFMTLADLRRVDQWRVEYISLREEPVGEFFATGSLPG